MIRTTILIAVLFLTACKNNDKPDVSHIKVDLRLERFEQSFFKMDSNHVREGLADLRNAHPGFYPFFMQEILRLNPVDPGSLSIVRKILTDYQPINDSIQKKYSNLSWLRDELSTGFKYVKYYFPDYRIPGIVTYIGEFSAPGLCVAPGYIGIGLHQFAGRNFSVYQEGPIQEMYPSYISRRFDKEYIAPGVMTAMVDDIYPDKKAGLPLIEQMVEKGKQWWLAEHFLPDAHDSLITGYTGKQMDWVKENEGNIWSYLMKNENLYSIEPETIQLYMEPGPFTQNMSEASPGQIGPWVGWRIVKKYAAAHSSLKLEEILAIPARTIFQESKYKPK
jgi:hypothetical protein